MSEIKNPLEQGEKAQAEKTTAPKTVEVKKDSLDAILKTIKEQEARLASQEAKIKSFEENGIEQKPRIVKRVKEHVCFLRTHKDEVVKGFDGNVYKEWDEKVREFVLYVDLVLYSGKVAKKVDYVDFISNAPKVKALIVKKDKEEKSEVEAYINKKEPSGEFGTVITDVIVPVENIIEEYTFEVDVDGAKYTLSEKAINI